MIPLLFDYPTISALSHYLLAEVLELPAATMATGGSAAARDIAPTENASGDDELELDLRSVEELRTLLDQKLADIEYAIED